MEKRQVHINGVKCSSVGMFEGAFALVVAFGLALAAWLEGTFTYSLPTSGLLRGLLLGMHPGFVTLIALPIVYFVVMWVVGFVHGALFNSMISWMGGIEAGTVPGHDIGEMVEPAAVPSMRRPEPTFGETVGPRRVD